MLVWKAWNKGKSNIIRLAAPGQMATWDRVRLAKGQEYVVKVEGGDGAKERIVCTDQAHYPSKKGPIFIIGADTGWNLVAPAKTDKPKLLDIKAKAKGEAAPEAPEDIYARMLVANPLAYEEAIEHDDFNEFLHAKQGKDPWQVRIAGLLALVLIAGLVTAGGVIWLVSKTQGV